MQLLNSANSDGEQHDYFGHAQSSSLQVFGTWDGCTVTIKGSMNDGVTFSACSNSDFFEDTITSFEMSVGKVKAFISNAGGATSINCFLSPG